MKLMKSLSVLGVVLVGLLVATGVSAEIRQDGMGNGAYGYYGGNNCGGGCCEIDRCPQPVQQCYQYPQPKKQCCQWVRGRWVPVRVMVPGRWEYRPVWIPGYPITLYKRLPGYCRQAFGPAQPDFSVWQTPNGWYGSPYHGQVGDYDRDDDYGLVGGYGQAGGYFDHRGVWHPVR